MITPRKGHTVEMPWGPAVVYLGSVPHGTAVNTADQPRSAIAAGYAVGRLRQEESQLLDCPPEAARNTSSAKPHTV